MVKRDFTVTIEMESSSQDVFKAITTDVRFWWGGNDLTGNTTKLNDEFVIHHPGAHYSRQKLIEIIPEKRLVWMVIDSQLNWLQKDKHEWTNTKMIFELTTQAGKTLLQFTHEGLTPEKECYNACTQDGWNIVITDWLFKFIVEGRAHFI